jgi:magnesium chelatase subunit I
MTVTNTEALLASAARRALRLGEADAAPRICDLDALAASTSGKVELESFDDERGGEVLEHLVKAAVLSEFRERLHLDEMRNVLEAFDDGSVINAGDDVAVADYVALVEQVPALREPVTTLTGGDESPAVVASAVEFVLEGLHLSKRLNKDAAGARAAYRARR